MSRARCPVCKSYNVLPSLANAGHDVCLSCQHSGVVASFHKDEDKPFEIPPRGNYKQPSAAPARPRRPKPEPAKTERKYWWQDL